MLYSDLMFVIGIALGGLGGAAVASWFAERQIKAEIKDWEALVSHQSGQIAEMRRRHMSRTP